VKKMLIILVAGFLASCAPILSAVQGEPATLTTDGATVLLSNPAATVAEDAVVTLFGPVTVVGAKCTPYSKSWICPVGDVPSGKGYRLSITGTLKNASATFYRAGSGDRPVYIQLK